MSNNNNNNINNNNNNNKRKSEKCLVRRYSPLVKLLTLVKDALNMIITRAD